ncbi:hypothetical protein K440DRAFT_630451, partial [Wilcoxina mikolae CBS 423.85]
MHPAALLPAKIRDSESKRWNTRCQDDSILLQQIGRVAQSIFQNRDSTSRDCAIPCDFQGSKAQYLYSPVRRRWSSI